MGGVGMGGERNYVNVRLYFFFGVVRCRYENLK